MDTSDVGLRCANPTYPSCGKLLGGKQAGARQSRNNAAGQRNAVAGDGDDGDAVGGEGQVLGHRDVCGFRLIGGDS